MSREYKFVDRHDVDLPHITRVYNEPGVSWREAKKQLRQWYLNEASKVRSLREPHKRKVEQVE